jgi:hypothetical protein
MTSKLLRRLSGGIFARYIRPIEERFSRDVERMEAHLTRELTRNAVLGAQPLIARLREMPRIPRLRDAEFRVFSQFGEDGIIQYLIQQVPIVNEAFIEFGVEDYSEANTRFLLVNNNWRGLILDGDPHLERKLRDDAIYWRHNLTAASLFVTAENINTAISNAGFSGDIGLLSIDVDGNDYWIWQALTVVSPRIVVCEYNSVFGCRYPVSVAYDPMFDKTRAHYSNLYFGASLPALCHLAHDKGYEFVGSNSTGHNAFFVRADLVGRLPKPTLTDEYQESRFRSSAGINGELTFLSGDARAKVIANLVVVDVVTGRLLRVAEL